MRRAIACTVSCLLLYVTATQGLSYSVCDSIGAEYTSNGPQLTGTWPFYNLLYTCTGNLTIEGYQIDACVDAGKSCGQAAADAFCQYLGFDKNAPTLYSTVTGTAPALSMTGGWCLSAGHYGDYGHPNRTQFEAMVAANAGPYCSVLSSVSCIRSRSTIASDLTSIEDQAIVAPATAPNSQLVPGAAYLIANSPPLSTAGRKMKGLASILQSCS